MKIKYEKNQIELIVKDCNSYSDVVRKLTKKDKVHGGMVDHIKKIILKYKIDISHFKKKCME
jgi:hypothetical protein